MMLTWLSFQKQVVAAEAVSYTHLDVYKRQVVHGLHELQDGLAPLGVALQRLQRGDLDDRQVVTGELVAGEQLPDPVSYTHLDVYKRQPATGGAPGRRPP